MSKTASRKYYLKNRKEVISRSRQTRDQLHALITELKKGKSCVDCKVPYPPYVMDFDHLDESTKDIEVSQIPQYYGYEKGKEKILEEVKKCDLVCANCHRQRTQDRF